MPSSRPALTAPAWIAFQNSSVVPLGITATAGRTLASERTHPRMGKLLATTSNAPTSSVFVLLMTCE
jgi:hypothetical protein